MFISAIQELSFHRKTGVALKWRTRFLLCVEQCSKDSILLMCVECIPALYPYGNSWVVGKALWHIKTSIIKIFISMMPGSCFPTLSDRCHISVIFVGYCFMTTHPMAGGFVRPYRKVFTFPVRSSHEFRAACSTSRTYRPCSYPSIRGCW